MKQVFLHIGLHKTGSSSIQETLFRNQDLLKEQGYHYFAEEIDGSKCALPQQWVRLNASNPEFPIFQEIDRFRNLISSVDSEKVIVSIEALSWFISEKSLSLLSEVFKNFSVNVIIYLRRQDQQLVSYIQEASKNRFKPSAVYYGNTTEALPQLSRFGYLDYNTRIRRLITFFGKDNVNVRLFQKGSLINDDVVDDFCSFLGIKVASKYRVNESVGFERQKVGQLINLSEIPNNSPYEMFLRNATDNTGKMLPARNDAISFYSQFKQSNLQLAKFLGLAVEGDIFSNDFDSYPEKANSYWSEESANKAIIRILNASAEYLNNVIKQPKPSNKELYVDMLRDDAISLIGKDNELAFNLLLRASELRPSGKFIKQKLKEVSDILGKVSV
tara:strand:- start:1223 stop:2383 length:1161 start_codon:yes stop_codon:yes gene_type:complete